MDELEPWPFPNFSLDQIDDAVLGNDSISAALTEAILEATMRARFLSALSSKGLAVVPVEPTEAMQDAGGSSIIRPSIYMGGTPPGAKRRARDVWADMLAAAPKEGQGA